VLLGSLLFLIPIFLRGALVVLFLLVAICARTWRKDSISAADFALELRHSESRTLGARLVAGGGRFDHAIHLIRVCVVRIGRRSSLI